MGEITITKESTMLVMFCFVMAFLCHYRDKLSGVAMLFCMFFQIFGSSMYYAKKRDCITNHLVKTVKKLQLELFASWDY